MKVLILLLLGLLAAGSLAAADLDVFELYSVYDNLDGTREGVYKTWDMLHTATCLQGLANRKEPHIYYIHMDSGQYLPKGSIDLFWLDKMTAPGEFLHGTTRIFHDSLDELLAKYRSCYKGLVVYDGSVAATSNAATTAAGAEDLLAVRWDPSPDSWYTHLTRDLKIPVRRRLVNKDGSSMFTGKGVIPGTKRESTGSAKCDVYIWAKENYLDKGKCSREVLGYYIDFYYAQTASLNARWLRNATLMNQDYIIANRGFVVDLNVWEDETPVDDRGQKPGTDLETFKEVLHSAWKQAKGNFIQVSGFIPWGHKYVDYGNSGGTHEGVASEWRHAELLSNYNCCKDADAIDFSDMTNASVFSLAPTKKVYKQKKPGVEELKAKGLIDENGRVKEAVYVSTYVGDYDAAAWLYSRMPEIWENPYRGKVELGWAFNPNLARRFAFGFDYFRKTAAPGDTFVAGDSGAGYVTPGSLQEPRRFSGLPDGKDAWERHCRYWFDKFDISAEGFILNGHAPALDDELRDLYTRIAPDGMAGHVNLEHDGVYKGVPYINLQADVYRPVEDAVNHARYMGYTLPEFYMFRNILWTPESQITFQKTMKENVDAEVVFLEPYGFFALMKYFYESGQEKQYSPFDYHSLTLIDGSDVGEMSDWRDLFGGAFSQVEKGMLLFKDEQPEGYVHSLTFATKEPVEIKRINLILQKDHSGANRMADRAALLGRLTESEPWETIYEEELMEDDFGPAYYSRYNLEKPVTARYFRLELTQSGADEDGVTRAPRAVELSIN